MPRRAYVFGNHTFVAHPGVRGFWIRTDVCVAYVACPSCKAERAEPCRGKRGGWTTQTHVTRRRLAKR